MLDMWQVVPPKRSAFTTVGNWKQGGRDVEFSGDTYRCSKNHEFLKFSDLPLRTAQPIELATNLAERGSLRKAEPLPCAGRCIPTN